MKNKLKFIIFILKSFLLLSTNVSGVEQFNFDITEVEITEKGNVFSGYKRGTITVDNGIKIEADEFNYDKISNILKTKGKVKVLDEINEYVIYSDEIIYLKNEEKIFTYGNSKAINLNTKITAVEFEYDKNQNIIKAKKKVKIEDEKDDIIILAEEIVYKKNIENIFARGNAEAKIQSKYNFISKNVYLNRNIMELSSNNITKIYDDNFNFYQLDNFKYLKKEGLLKGNNVKITTNINNTELSDVFTFDDGFFNLKQNNFKASKTKVLMHKNLFGNQENDPRLNGVSSFKKDEITQINKGIFTSCNKKHDDCPPWLIEAKKIKHDKNKKQLIYDNALLKIYNFPVVYFPKFFHPDPSVERQSGILVPILNESQILGSSIQIPYFHVLSKKEDITIRPNIFDNHIFMLQNEYRKKTEHSSLLADFGFTKGYKSSLSNKKKNISHLFAKYKLDLNLDDFISSNLDLDLQKVTNDTYLKVFDGNLSETAIKPSQNKLSSSLNLTFEHENYNFSTGLTSYETLDGKNSDRYQFILPYYSFSKNLFTNQNIGTINLNSSGSNNLKDTNNLRSRIVNDVNFTSLDYISNFGFKNNFGINFKNLNTVAKNDTIYKSSPQIELMSIFEATSSLPLIKYGQTYDSYLEPKFSLRFNPGDMKDYSGSDRKIGTSNIFSINRLGLTDSFEGGKSLTVGLDYKFENIENINKYFEFKIASVFRDKIEQKIPTSSSIKQSGNLIGFMKNNVNQNLNFIYDFSIDNDLETVEYNSLTANLSLNKFSTGLKFIEENGKIGDANSIENTISYKFDDNNFLSFSTRRNRKINLTEFYDLIYEYKNDCLTAGLKYKKTYYQDRDLLPTENLMFSVTIFPLTTYEKSFDRN